MATPTYRTSRRITRMLLAILLAGTVGAVASPGAAHASVADCAMSLTLPVPPWNGGFQVSVTVTNVGTVPSTSWVVLVFAPWGTTPVQWWNAQAGTPWSMTTGVLYNFANLYFNGALAPGQSTTFGFSASGPPDVTGFTCGVS